MATKTLYVGDVHVSDDPPGYRQATYRNEILDKVAWAMTEAHKRGCDAALFAGDMFHRKRGITHGLVGDLADVLGMFSGPKFIVPGNHDMLNNDPDVDHRALGVLGRMENVHLALEPFNVGADLRVHPRPYRVDMSYADLVLDAEDTGVGRWQLLVVHYGVTPRVMPYETLVTDSPDWPTTGADAIFAGHIHDDMGAWRAADGTPVFNLGSLSRGSLTEDNRTRIPRVLLSVWPDDLEGKPDHQAINVPCKPAEEVFRLADKDAEVEGERIAAEFLERLGATEVAQMSPEALRAGVMKMDVPDAVKEKAVAAIEVAFSA